MVGDDESRPKSGVLTSPDYPRPYPDDLDTTQIIQVAEGKTIRFAWTDFTTEPRHDYVQVLDDDGTNLTTRLSGSAPVLGDDWFTSNSNIVRVKFHTDGDTQRTGWRLEWNEVSIPMDLP